MSLMIKTEGGGEMKRCYQKVLKIVEKFNKYEVLALDVIKQAMKDLVGKNRIDRDSSELFFNSEWYRYLCDLLDLDHAYIYAECKRQALQSSKNNSDN